MPPTLPVADPLIADLVRRCKWPTAGEVDVATSGGTDSVALVVLALASGRAVRAHHVDHGLRPTSGAEAEAVRTTMVDLGATPVVHRVTVGAGPNLEARARAARYGVLPAGILVGHTADDRAETVLLNVLRGSGLDGLAPMADASRVRRPLLHLRRADTALVCRQAGVVPFEDPSNTDRRLRRNDLRAALPVLTEVAGRDLVPVLARQATLLADDAALLEDLARAVEVTDARALAAAPAPLARRAIRAWLRRSSDPEHHPPSAAEVERVLAVARGDVVATEVSGGRRVARSANILSVSETPQPKEHL